MTNRKCIKCNKLLSGKKRKYCSRKCTLSNRPLECKNCKKKYFGNATSSYCSKKCKKENFVPSSGLLKKWKGIAPVKFRFCKLCNTDKRYDFYREVHNTNHGWLDIQNKRRYSMCIDCENDRQKFDRNKFPEKRLFLLARRRAKTQKLPFDITKKYIKSIWPKDNKCPILGTVFKSGKVNKYQLPSLDKIIPQKGYIKGNVAVISYRANQIKSDVVDFSVFDKIYKFYKKK